MQPAFLPLHSRVVGLFLCACASLAPAAPAAPATTASFVATLRPFLAEHCVKCHGPEKQKGDARLDALTGDLAKDRELLTLVRDQLRDGLMPPKKEKQPDAALARRVVATLSHALPKPQTAEQFASDQLPNKGNLIPHDLLFGQPAGEVTPPAARLWRLNSDSYLGLVSSVARGRMDSLVKPFTLIPERGLKDYAALYSMDEPTTEILLRNAATIVERQSAHDFKDGKLIGKNDTIREFVALMDPAKPPTPEQVAAVVKQQFTLAIGRVPGAEEVARYQAFYETCARDGDRPAAVRTVLQAVLLRADAVFRSELGGVADGKGRRMLAPGELAVALSLALGNKRLEPLTAAAAKGELVTKEQIAARLQAILDTPDKRLDTSRLLAFFQQYFEYHRAPEIFKEERFPFAEKASEFALRRGNWPKGDLTLVGSIHHAANLVADTDRLVQRILAEDKDVLRQLLTTDITFVNLRFKEDKQTRQPVPVPASELNPNNHRGIVGPHYVYGFAAWPAAQPVKAPADQPRLGVLMQPAWLVAHSTNFENDPVRRGRWIRERLLGQTVPDLPIGVVAQVPDEPHRAFRDRLQVTREAKCWKCHQWMDELGLPFEQFTHYGVFQKAELVVDAEATAKHLDKNGKPLGKVFTTTKLNTTGEVAHTDDPQLDGPVKDAYELVRRLADSTRVRQVFVRHVFRYFMGRNESLADARSLQEADRAYVASGGSFKALVVALLTSDSFLYRSSPTTTAQSK
ncbi:MAG: hypothetical protein RL514_3353 [Verrucomicrobiota bacterium]|jgi:mono/diheme cytochrome c family protein